MTPFIQAAGWTLVHFVWQGVLIAIGTAFVLELLAFRSPRSRYFVACLGLLAMLAAPALTLSIASASGAPAPAVAVNEFGSSSIDRHEFGALPPLKPLTSGDAAFSVSADSLMTAVVTIWAVGVLLLLIRMAGGWWRVRRLHRLALMLERSSWQPICDRIAARLRITRAVRVVDSVLVDTPSVVGWLQPVVVLPVAALSGLTPAQVEAILAHELAHIGRHDFAVNLLQSIAETLLFYHPAVWWMSARVRAEREYCCDDVAVEFSGDALNYVSALAELESRRRDSGAMVLGASGGSLLDRVGRLLRVPADSGLQTSGWLVTVVLTVMFVAGAGVVQWLPDAIDMRAVAQAPAQATVAPPVAQQTPATPATPVAPSSPQRPAPSARPTLAIPGDSENLSVRLRDQDFRIRWHNGWSSRELSGSGDLTFNDDLTDLRALSTGGYLFVREWASWLPRSVEIHSDGGRIVHRYFVAGFERSWSADSQRWLAERLPSLVRQSGLAARARVRQIYAANGIDGVLAEINGIESDYARRVYLRELEAVAQPLDASTTARVIGFAGAVMSSDYNLSETLRDVAAIAATDVDATKAYVSAADRLDSDYEHRRALVALFKAGPPISGAAELAVASAGNIHSNFEQVETLRVAVQEGWLGSGDALFKAITQMNSDFEKRRILSFILKGRSNDIQTQKRLLAAASTIDSDFECTEFLLAFLRDYGVDPANRVEFFDAVDAVQSSFERHRVLAALVRGETLSPEMLHEVLAAAADMGSDYERAELLLDLLRRQRIDSVTRDSVLDVVDKMGSSYDQGRVLVALVKSERR